MHTVQPYQSFPSHSYASNFSRRFEPDARSVADSSPCKPPDLSDLACWVESFLLDTHRDSLVLVRGISKVPRSQSRGSLKRMGQSRIGTLLPTAITYSIARIDRGSSMKRRVIRPPEYIVDWCRSFSMGMTWLKSYNGQVPSYRRRAT